MFDHTINKNDLIDLFEDNSGTISHKGYKKLLDIVYKKVIKKFDDYVEKDDRIDTLTKSERTIRCEYDFRSDGNFMLSSFRVPNKLIVKIDPINISEDQSDWVIIQAGMETVKNDVEIVLYVNRDKSVGDLLSKKDKIEVILSHELVHLFKYLHGKYQRIGWEFLKKTEPLIDYKKYLTDRNELESYLTQINVENKNIFNKNKQTTLFDALKLNKSFINYFSELNKSFGINPSDLFLIKSNDPTSKIKKFMFKKIVHYWTKELKGKLKN